MLQYEYKNVGPISLPIANSRHLISIAEFHWLTVDNRLGLQTEWTSVPLWKDLIGLLKVTLELFGTILRLIYMLVKWNVPVIEQI